MECIQNTYVKNQDFYSKYITFHCKIIRTDNGVSRDKILWKLPIFQLVPTKCESSDVRVNFKTYGNES